MSSSHQQSSQSSPSSSPDQAQHPSAKPPVAPQSTDPTPQAEIAADISDPAHQALSKPMRLQKPQRPTPKVAPPSQPPPTPAAISSPPSTEDVPPLAGQQPISPPSEPMQYRAIGLVQGRYQPSEEQFNRGTVLTTADGETLDAVLLGQIISLIKKYLDLEQSYLWVVYPRTREKEETLHLQIMGVWSEQGFGPMAAELEAEDSAPANALVKPLQDGYFSIRGEVVHHDPEHHQVIVQVQQSPRKKSDSSRNFKLHLSGTLHAKALGYFWDLQVQREKGQLVIKEATAIGLVPPKKRKKTRKFLTALPRKPRRQESDVTRQGPDTQSASWQTPRVITKPLKRSPPDADT